MNRSIKEKRPKYHLNTEGEFVIENYNFAKPFANFFPGIAGKYGIPMWVFYVNRGQAICSFGIKDKSHAILEFMPANKAWQAAPVLGFRTFIKARAGKKTLFYEPFHNGFTNLGFDLGNRMRIGPAGLTLEEENRSLGLQVKSEYFNIPNDSYAGLARILTVKNLSSSPKDLQLIDGLPQIIPFGTSDTFLKTMSRTIEAWMRVENLDKGVPFYKLDVDPADRPEVIHIKEGNFYLGFQSDNGAARILKPIVNPQDVFGPVTDFSCPREFLAAKKFRHPAKEADKSRTPSALFLADLMLKAKEEKSIYAIIGHMRSLEILNSSIKRIASAGYLARKKKDNKEIIQGLQQDIFTASSSREFDLYAKQTYLDNIMRGGYPLLFEPGNSKSVFYLYSRKHGDLERDYNHFLLQPSYFSQGNGNYRDINQNRRSDVWFNPEIKDQGLVYFLNLIQADGFNPLVVKGTRYKLKDGFDPKIPALETVLKKPFTPGELLLFIEENKLKLNYTCEELLNKLISNSVRIQEAEHGEGFWTDHWTYNLDLIESYLSVYPEKYESLFFADRQFSFFDNSEVVRPRSQKYLLWHGAIRQLHSVAVDTAKREMIKKRREQPHLVRAQYGEGEIYHTTLINKLLCLLGNKLASLDPFGVGVEMEANKPNWFDALNGLPALFGSSICETFELKRLALMIKGALENCSVKEVPVTEEVAELLSRLNKLIEEYFGKNSPERDYLFWDQSNNAKEGFRAKTKCGLSGRETDIAKNSLISILDNAVRKINAGLEKARDKKSGIYYAYFINEVAKYETNDAPYVEPVKFIQKRLPLFLSGQMHALRSAQDSAEASGIYRATKATPLHDKKLKMYKVCAPLEKMPPEIGRCRVFAPGWLENESIWLHMEYKYLLELLKQGLYEEFYGEFKNVLVPFQNPQRYGRSILENSSFIVSSAFADKTLHGNGFVARLSGSTAEFLSIWLIMNAGPRPFLLNDKKELILSFRPALAGWLFDKKEKTYAFNFLSSVCVIYHNPQKKDTFGVNAAKISRIIFNDKDAKLVELPQDTIPPPYAEQIRSRLIKRIDIYLE